ncbi:MAG: phosphoribosylanthranilate isomerase [Candidatus Endonucleobacter bathymodioli]|uniref:N-(5'-phosphoribosyl)anthranilate isomerase n=1 Tax=Candidatus Endonucleibacter bathymodioli TaxID=539814 RepID=A0AA90NLS2_9GAMM|nr:phosphoribosylanthranilate isomerase [Candidatus Endonucleobacter bathymodioli]
MIAPRIKVCGISTVHDAVAATDVGIDILGLVFYGESPRFVTIERASDIASSVPPFTLLVGLFVNALESDIAAVLERLPLGLLQFHGDESVADCSRWSIPYIKALRVRPGVSISDMAGAYDSAKGYLLDTYRAGVAGGTGESFDWGLIPDDLKKPVILAGGLNPENIRAAIDTVQPYGVDVSSGVESSPGVKSVEKIKAFIHAAGR